MTDPGTKSAALSSRLGQAIKAIPCCAAKVQQLSIPPHLRSLPSRPLCSHCNGRYVQMGGKDHPCGKWRRLGARTDCPPLASFVASSTEILRLRILRRGYLRTNSHHRNCDKLRPSRIILSEMFLRWQRIAALFILLWAVVDMSVPSLCQADSDFLPVPQQQSATLSVDQNRDSQPAFPSNDDDCFCCCSHVSPTPHFELSVIASRQETVAPDPVIHRLEYTEPHYHPPRV